MNKTLPASKDVNVAAFSRFFDKTTNSYKLIFFQALLKLIGQREITSGNWVFALREIAIEMVAIAWYPHIFFHLSFGEQDQLHKVLNLLDFTVDGRAIATAKTQMRLRSAISAQYDVICLSELLRYVPFRLLAPFFDASLLGSLDHKKNVFIRALADQSFNSNEPVLYRFVGENAEKIELHQNWVIYLLHSWPIVSGWVHSQWIAYLQNRNPNTPAIINKIVAPTFRSPLIQQAAYWRTVMEQIPVRCLYSNEVLEPENFSLDHFIPWSFVCHDQLWNLIPVLPEANFSKGNRLPATSYIERFICLQTSGLEVVQKSSPKKWRKFTEPFVNDLRVSYIDLLNPDRLNDAYVTILPALISLATQSGFAGNWMYRVKN